MQNHQLADAVPVPGDVTDTFEWHPDLAKVHGLQINLAGRNLLDGIPLVEVTDDTARAEHKVRIDEMEVWFGLKAYSGSSTADGCVWVVYGHEGISQPTCRRRDLTLEVVFASGSRTTLVIDAVDGTVVNGQGLRPVGFDIFFGDERASRWVDRVGHFNQTRLVKAHPNQTGFDLDEGRFALRFEPMAPTVTRTLLYGIGNHPASWDIRADQNGWVLHDDGWAHPKSLLPGHRYHVRHTTPSSPWRDKPSNGWDQIPDAQHADAGVVALCQAVCQPGDSIAEDLGSRWLVAACGRRWLGQYQDPDADLGVTHNRVASWAMRGKGRIVMTGEWLAAALNRCGYHDLAADVLHRCDRIMAEMARVFVAESPQWFKFRSDGVAWWEASHWFHGLLTRQELRARVGDELPSIERQMMEIIAIRIFLETRNWGDGIGWALPYNTTENQPTVALTAMSIAVYEWADREDLPVEPRKLQEIRDQYAAAPSRWRL